MTRAKKRLLLALFLNQTSLGVYLLLIGAVLPLIRAEYGLSYRLSGIMMGLQSAGYFVAGVTAPLLPRKIGIKNSYIILLNLALIGLIVIMLTGNPFLLLCAMLMTGISKGACGNYNNAIVSSISGNSASLLNFLQACFAIGACIAPLIAAACGSNWRRAFMVEIVFAGLILIYSLGMKIGAGDYPVADQKGGADFGFFRSKVFWICAVFLSCYMAIEACIMGFLVTFYVDTGLVNEGRAQMLSVLLWVAVLAGRLACSVLSTRFKPAQMLMVMSIGVAVSFTLFIFGGSIVPVTIGSVGLGLFMGGMYGTAIGDVGDMLEKYSMCMGMLIVIPGLVSTFMPSLIGVLADLWDIRRGMMAIFVLIVLLLAVTVVDVRNQKALK
ncbi:MAG: MFS transporter [Lachnospiraceae bacterium]|nr:MFS transporter [Lachnospiraceae bacterium]